MEMKSAVPSSMMLSMTASDLIPPTRMSGRSVASRARLAWGKK
jgi:hypothetical protein